MSCFSVRVLGTLQTSVYVYLVPVVTVLTSHILLDEHFTLMIRVGTILTLTGLVLSSLDILSEAYRFRGGKGTERSPFYLRTPVTWIFCLQQQERLPE